MEVQVGPPLVLARPLRHRSPDRPPARATPLRHARLPTGYLWLGVGGVLWRRYGAVVAGPAHDAELHALFLGFVFSMIFGHAPVIFPGVLGVATAARWGGLLNATAIGLFLLVTIASAALAHTRRAQAAAPTQLEQPAGAGR
jgi:hypothetical protein